MPTIMPVSDVRKQLLTLLGRLERPIYITQRGRARAVLVDVEQWDELMEEMEDLRLACDPAFRAKIARLDEWLKDEDAIRAAEARGDLIPLDELQAEAGQDEQGGDLQG